MFEPMRFTESSVFHLLRERYPKTSCALLPQVADRTGSPTRYADAIAMQLWPSRGLSIEGFEIKVSRQDWLRELQNEAKADVLFTFCDRWWVVAPAGIVQLNELPTTWGLIEVVLIAGQPRLHEAVRAPKHHDALEPNRAFVASLLRSLQAHASPEADVEAKVFEVRKQLAVEATKLARKTADAQTQHIQSELDRLRKSVDAFEKASGVHIDTWSASNAEVLGRRFQTITQGEHVVAKTVACLEQARSNAERLSKEAAALIEQLK